MPAVTEPPGLLMYSQMSLAASSPSRYSSWAQIWLAISSLTSVPSMITRFFSSRLKTSMRPSGEEASNAYIGGILGHAVKATGGTEPQSAGAAEDHGDPFVVADLGMAGDEQRRDRRSR